GNPAAPRERVIPGPVLRSARRRSSAGPLATSENGIVGTPGRAGQPAPREPRGRSGARGRGISARALRIRRVPVVVQGASSVRFALVGRLRRLRERGGERGGRLLVGHLLDEDRVADLERASRERQRDLEAIPRTKLGFSGGGGDERDDRS